MFLQDDDEMTDERDEQFIPGMTSGNEFDFEEGVPPLRVSGFICFALGAASCLSILFKPLLFLPLAAFACGLIALRKYDGPRPAGTRIAAIGMLMGVAFGSCGYTVNMMKRTTLSRQAEEFAEQYMKLVALGHDEHAMELQKEWYNRLPTDMNLSEHYLSDQRITESLVTFKDDMVNRELKQRGVDAEWVLDRPIRVYFEFGKDHAEVIWVDPTGESKLTIQMFMDYNIDSHGRGQWQMKTVQPMRRPLVAESVL